jgi:hypothetical protein
MANYPVKIAKIAGHETPTLLADFGTWLKMQTYGALGYFELMTETIPKQWNAEAAVRLAKSGLSFLSLPEGSLLVLLTHDAKSPAAVVMLGSEGETATVAQSLEAFLIDLSKSKTGIGDLDDEGPNRKALAAWLKEKKVTAPKAKGFDFDLWLAGETSPKAAKTAAPAIAKIAMSKEIAALSPKLRVLASMMGRRADDPELIAYITKTLGAKLPKNTSTQESSTNVVAKKHGIEMSFSHEAEWRKPNKKYPPIALTARAFIPYLSFAWVRAAFGETLPYGITIGMPAKDLPNLLGKPARTIGQGSLKRPIYERVLDRERDIVLDVEGWEEDGAAITLAIRGE